MATAQGGVSYSKYDPDILAAEVIDIDKQVEIIMEIISKSRNKSSDKDATVTSSAKAAPAAKTAARGEVVGAAAAKEESITKGATYMHGQVRPETPKKSKSTGKGRGSAAADVGRNKLKAFYTKLIQENAELGKEWFEHSTEGLVIRRPEADYALKIVKSKAVKFDPAEEGFELEKDFSVRGKAKNSAPGIANLIYCELENEIQNGNFKMKIVNVKASGIVVHFMGGEYTIKIAKKRDRVGFQG